MANYHIDCKNNFHRNSEEEKTPLSWSGHGRGCVSRMDDCCREFKDVLTHNPM